MNNKGFAITTVLYGTFLVFLMLIITMLGILSSYKDKMQLLTGETTGAKEIIGGEILKATWSDIEVGDYIKYSANGHEGWQVLFITPSYIEIISDVGFSGVKLEGDGHYIEYVKKLNDAVSDYKTGKATAVRHLGSTRCLDSNGCSKSILTTAADLYISDLGDCSFPYSDDLYKNDVNQLNTYDDKIKINGDTFLASRHCTTQLFSTVGVGYGRYITSSYEAKNAHLQQYNVLIGQSDRRALSALIRPVVTLPAGCTIGAGDGKSAATAWELIYE